MSIWKFSPQELERYLAQEGIPSYRAKQIWDWIWNKGVHDWEAMSNLPLSLRHKLAHKWPIPYVKVVEKKVSRDGTEKFLFSLPDGKPIESVLIPHKNRRTLCISSQVGCGMGCKFCATGQMGFHRNLAAEEIFWQVQFVQSYLRGRAEGLTHIVYMGMGEPLLNLSAVVQSLHLTHAHIGLSYRRFTISTVGIPKGIERLANLSLPFHLAVSLHSAIQDTRAKLIPLAEKVPLDALSESLRLFSTKRKSWVTLEYVLLGGVNDDAAHAEALIDFVRGVQAKINLIPYNPVPGLTFYQSRRLRAFSDALRSARLIVNIRHSRGQDIEAACGQLAANSSSFGT
ncbi:MAG: 23S rRNA (adenine(2503)-C(2))-methyltransferase RlmN [Bacteroidia bacterium]